MKRPVERVRSRDRSSHKGKRGLPELPLLNKELFEELRRLRKELADRRGVPPFVIFGDRTLHEIAAALPETVDDFLAIHGVGEGKARKHGDTFLKAVALFVEENPNVTPLSENERRPAPAPSAPVDPDQLNDSTIETGEFYRRGISMEDIVVERNLSRSTIEKHVIDLIRHGIIDTLDRIVDEQKAAMIREAFEEVGNEMLRPVMDHLGEDAVTFFELRAVRAVDQATAANTTSP